MRLKHFQIIEKQLYKKDGSFNHYCSHDYKRHLKQIGTFRNAKGPGMHMTAP
jgi:hypothetical protein